MNYQIINHDYMNTGGHCMVSVFEVWIKDVNKTVFVNIGEEYITMTTVNHIWRDLDIDDYNDITIAEYMYCDGDYAEDGMDYELCRECLHEYLKKDCEYFEHKEYLPFEWLLPEQQKLVENYKQHMLTYEIERYVTDGDALWIETESGATILVTEEAMQPMTLEKTIAASLFRMKELYMCNHEVMDDDDLGDLLTTINSLEHWFAKLN